MLLNGFAKSPKWYESIINFEENYSEALSAIETLVTQRLLIEVVPKIPNKLVFRITDVGLVMTRLLSGSNVERYYWMRMTLPTDNKYAIVSFLIESDTQHQGYYFDFSLVLTMTAVDQLAGV